MEKRKNILLITSDQQRWDTIGKLNPQLKTPNLDRLSAEGITFTRAYTPNPTCTPARCSILTGQYPSRHGAYIIGTSLPEKYPTVPEVMSKNGYLTALMGKGHFQSCIWEESFEAPPKVHDLDFFDKWEGPYYGFEKAKLCIGHSNEKHACGMHYGSWLRKQGVDRDRYWGTMTYRDYGKWELPEEYHNSRWVADITMETIDQSVDEERPFFIWSSFQDPHNPCVAPEKWADLYNEDDMPNYQYVEGEHDDKPELYNKKLSENTFGADSDFGNKNWHCVQTDKGIEMGSEKAHKEIMKYYYGMVSLMDHHIGRILEHLEKTGQLENTIIIFTTDHGDYMGNHGYWWKGLPAYEDIQRLPFIVRHPQCKTPGELSESYQSLVDLGDTFLGVAGIDNHSLQTQGVNLEETWKDKNSQSRDWALVEFRPTEADFMQKSLLHDDHKLVVYHGTEEGELYHLKDDPEQMNNLWNDEGHKDMKMKLLMKLTSAEMEKDGKLYTRNAPA